jgi:hypothetical protein
MAAMSSDWLNNWKSLKIFFRTMGWIETKFSQNAGTAHPLEQMRASSNQIIVFTQLEIYKLQSVVSCNYTPASERGRGYTVLPLSILPSVQDIFRRIFLSNC